MLLLSIDPKAVKSGSQEDVCASMFVTAFFINQRTEAVQMSINEGMGKHNTVYSATRMLNSFINRKF